MAASANLRLHEIEEEISAINTKLEELSIRRRELVSKQQKSGAGAQPKVPPAPETSFPPSSGPPTPGTNQPGRTGQAASSGPSAGRGSPGGSFFNHSISLAHPPSNFAKGTQQQVASPAPAPAAKQTTPSRIGPTGLTQPGPSGSSRTPARPKSRKKKVVCPAGNKCNCGIGWECPTCGSCLDGCVPPCPEALKQIEIEKQCQQFWEEVRGETASEDPTQPGTSSGTSQVATPGLPRPGPSQTPQHPEVSTRTTLCKFDSQICRLYSSIYLLFRQDICNPVWRLMSESHDFRRREMMKP